MTHFGEAASKSGPSGELGVHSLDHFALAVPDIGEASRFYTAFGLELRSDGNLMAMHTAGAAQRSALLLEGSPKRLHHLSFGVFDEDLDRFKNRLQELGVNRLDPP